MLYALKPSSTFIDIKSANKILYFSDEKSLIRFFHHKMKDDLLNPIAFNERWSAWRNNKANGNPLEVTGYLSLLVSADCNLQQLSNLKKTRVYIADLLGNKNTFADYTIVRRIRSLPCNYTLYKLYDYCDGKAMKRLGWATFFKHMKKDLNDVSLDYKIPQDI
jgi:hypothetical protein